MTFTPYFPPNNELTAEDVAHILRRCCFSFNKEDVDYFTGMTPDDVYDELFTPIGSASLGINTGNTFANLNNLASGSSSPAKFKRRKLATCWWMDDMIRNGNRAFAYKLMFFWHTVFVSSFNIVENNGNRLNDQNSLFFDYFNGNLKDIAILITRDFQMLRYLNNEDNKYIASSPEPPQENYAREFLELFTIGKEDSNTTGDYVHYTEQDVTELANILTGFNIQNYNVSINPNHHNFGEKQFSDKILDSNGNAFRIEAEPNTGNHTALAMEIEFSTFVDALFSTKNQSTNNENQPRVAVRICERLYKFFIKEEIDLDTQTKINNLAEQLVGAHDYNMDFAIRTILESEDFFSEKNRGSLVKTPFELLAHIISYFHLAIPEPEIEDASSSLQPNSDFREFWLDEVYTEIFTQLGFTMFRPPNVSGYIGYQENSSSLAWFNTGTLINRYSMGDLFVDGIANSGGDIVIKIIPLLRSWFGSTYVYGHVLAEKIVALLVRDLFPAPMPPTAPLFVRLKGILENGSAGSWDDQVISNNGLLHLTNAGVIRMKKMLKELFHSPEFQLK